MSTFRNLARKNNIIRDFNIDITELLPISAEVTAYFQVEFRRCKAEPQNGIYQPYNEMWELSLIDVCDTSAGNDVVIDVEINNDVMAKIESLALDYVAQL